MLISTGYTDVYNDYYSCLLLSESAEAVKFFGIKNNYVEKNVSVSYDSNKRVERSR